jgi:alpha-tubulin suppressor-like RCC1 family protein
VPNIVSVTLSRVTIIVTLAAFSFAAPPAVDTADARQSESAAVELTSGFGFTCARLRGGAVRCWGTGYNGELGSGRTEYSSLPRRVDRLRSGVTAIAANGYHACAVTTSDEVKCWGSNFHGELGDGTMTGARYRPVRVKNLRAAEDVGVGLDHSCANLANGEIRCWGNNHNGQLGNGGDGPFSLSPSLVEGVLDAASPVMANYLNSCVMLSAAEPRCWGANDDGQLGNGSWDDAFAPSPVSLLSGDVSAITPGQQYTCAVMTAGGVSCWGDNAYGQLGDGTTVDRFAPVGVVGLGGPVMAVALAGGHACALRTDGRVECWGRNVQGQLGDGTRIDRTKAVRVRGLPSDVLEVTVGANHSCALAPSGVFCWGANDAGQLGDGTTKRRLFPVKVLLRH